MQHDPRSPESEEPAKVILVDDFPLRRAAYASLVERWTSQARLVLETAGTWSSSGDLATQSLRLIIVCTGGLSADDPKADEMIAAIRALVPACPIAILSDNCDSSTVLGALKLGVQGFVPTELEPHVAIEALKFVSAGGVFFPPSALITRSGQETTMSESGNGLTQRQTQVIELLQLGKSNKLIARELGMQEATVKVHVRQIMRKLGVANRTQAALQVRDRLGLNGDAKDDHRAPPTLPPAAMAVPARIASPRRYFP